jgi:PAS domain S-box-containing protein
MEATTPHGAVGRPAESLHNEKALREYQTTLSLAMQGSRLGAWRRNVKTNEVWWGRELEEIFGLPPGGFEGSENGFYDFVHPDDRAAVGKAVEQAIAGGTDYIVEFRYLHADGSIRWMEGRGKAIYDSAGGPVELFGIGMDITERKRNERTMRELEERFAKAFHANPNPMTFNSLPDGRYVDVNEAMLRESGFGREEVIGHSALELGFFPEKTVLDQVIAELLENGSLRNRELRLWSRKHGLRTVLFSAETITLEEQLYALTTAVDITDRKKAEARLQKTNKRFRLAEQASNGFIYDWNLLTDEASRTEGFSRVLGYGPDELPLTGSAWFDLINPDDRHHAFAEFQKATAGRGKRYQLEYRVRHRHGHWVAIHDNGVIIRDPEGRARRIVGAAVDQTVRQHAEQKLRQSEEHLKAMAATLPQLIWTARADGTVDYFNEPWYAYTGARPEECLDNNWVRFLHPDDSLTSLDSWNQALRNGESVNTRHRLRAADGTYRWHVTRGMPLKNAAGEVIKWFGSCTDIQEEKNFSESLEKMVRQRTEALEQANHHLARSNEALERFAYVASHDLQEPLRKLQTFGRLILSKEEATFTEKGRDYFDRMIGAAQRMQVLLEALLNFSRTTAPNQNKVLTSLSQLLDEVRADLHENIEDRQARIEAGPLPALPVVPFQVRQLLTNLIGNALKYTRPGVAPNIRIRGRWIDGAEVSPPPGAAPAPRWFRLTVEDDGIGFEPEYAEKIFELFARLHGKSDYSGSGIGLSICQKVAENHGGFIRAEGFPGEGARFEVYFPEEEERKEEG